MGPDQGPEGQSAQGEFWACGYLQTSQHSTYHSRVPQAALRWWVLTEMPAVNCKMHTRFQRTAMKKNACRLSHEYF